jgi:hypothetical protein
MYEIDAASVIGNNAFSIDGVISILEGEDQEKFLDELINYLESKGAYFFGFTDTIEGEAMREGKMREILTNHMNTNSSEEESKSKEEDWDL